jgi:hypothetical protein
MIKIRIKKKKLQTLHVKVISSADDIKVNLTSRFNTNYDLFDGSLCRSMREMLQEIGKALSFSRFMTAVLIVGVKIEKWMSRSKIES